ncbi:Holliday junction branch migration protein RuvA [Caldanaerobius polysaccharolyticus]|uniref:Holliday junction branch migration protein RuvA n=1 Tax=Caldanaerobius polysaccharolyticus TaxID=44256 RepID=UPI00047AA443|nr:Holliday junction branch migration protein RuvA [Caldanaerobius polysaccharolyticus]
MLDYIKGKVIEVDDESVVVEASGVGYRLFVSSITSKEIKVGDTTKLYVYLYLRENEMRLFGFYDRNERKVFKSLISVSGIGPKVALNILSKYTPSQMLAFIATGDFTSIMSVPGVGKKTAQRLIVELKDRVNKEELGVSFIEDKTSDVVQALMALGYSKDEISRVLKKIEGLDIDDAIKMALKELS